MTSRSNWFNEHPKFQQILSNGFDKYNPSSSRTAMLVYLELCERKHWFEVEIHPCDSLKRVFITGKPRKKAKKEAVVPVCVETEFSVDDLRSIVSEISTCCKELDLDLSGNPGVILGICESDSSIVYYKVYQGLEQPGQLMLGELEQEEK
ncbi:tRNA-splicing endonuclease subunit SEN15-like [Exaiptasia diaphana]|uniref:tRNA-splicing endonuclease subunit Sen15 domain-containing protein n=1 Tax=Exaiptasia diaphana TaxID=2652724 RepID=A0A913XCG4_EXADI|nr:tRNA-splicing endonuclease subunit SEN15-like [Exaiptasia diaphana]XP_020902399.1 tRNA-splicing endonuclease subunit SEN15-like [Exaiptasia diaphana]